MKILALDIETRPAIVYTWSLYQPIIGIEQVIDPGGLMCFSAKWLGEKKIHFQDNFNNDDWFKIEMNNQLWEFLNAADAVLHFNGSTFDIPHIQREFMEQGLLPPSPFKQIDLLSVVKKKARFLSNKLAHVAPQLGLEGKIEHEGFSLWRKCMDGDETAQRLMRKYNIRDTKLLEEAYEILKPWIPHHPSHAALHGTAICPRCGSAELEHRGYAVLTTGRYPRIHCLDCGSWSRESKRVDATNVIQI